MSLLERSIAISMEAACPDGDTGDAWSVSALKDRVQERISADRMALLMRESPGRARAEVRSACRAVFSEGWGVGLSATDLADLVDQLLDAIFGLGPLELPLEDETVTEVMVNGTRSLFVEREGKLVEQDNPFTDDAQVRALIDRIIGPLGRRIDESSPMVNARLPQGHRVNAVIPPLALDGSVLTIRKFREKVMTLEEMVQAGSMDERMAQLLAWAVRARKNVAVTGGTGSGKTTLLNALSCKISPSERILTIEDSAELRFFEHPHVVRLEARPRNAEGRGEVTIRDLVTNALRMRPDRIVVGEVRDVEALEIINAMTTGHDGSLTTIHANDAQTALSRLETMLLKSSSGYDAATVRKMIAQAVDLVVVIGRMLDGTRKILSVNAIAGMEGPVISLEELFAFEQGPLLPGGRVSGAFAGAGFQPERVRNRIESWGVAYNPSWFFDRHEVSTRPAKEGAAL